MDRNPDDIVRVASGNLIQVEVWRDAITDAGIASRIVGDDLSGSFGSVLPGSVELWVHREDLAVAEAAIQRAEEHKGQTEQDRPAFDRPVSDNPTKTNPQAPSGTKFNTGERGH
ncbi:MAG: DUF2007 domain-containing protein [Bacteroidales bacterium]|nr:DUF2007 domain-containing protein [Bacteroidales bacterium]